MPLEAVIEWAITLFIFGLLASACVQALWPVSKVQPKDELERFPAATDEQAILQAMNSLEALIDWRKGNTDSNLILDDRKWGLFKRATREYGIIPTFNQKAGRWEAFDGKFR